ncbi:MAG: hypothetical protein B7Z06_04615, partial [Flavobacteriales bacterium 32-35-8]
MLTTKQVASRATSLPTGADLPRTILTTKKMITISLLEAKEIIRIAMVDMTVKVVGIRGMAGM